MKIKGVILTPSGQLGPYPVNVTEKNMEETWTLVPLLRHEINLFWGNNKLLSVYSV